MARTKYTAKKTTGALGVHADIPPPSSRRTNAARQTTYSNRDALDVLSSDDLGPDSAVSILSNLFILD